MQRPELPRIDVLNVQQATDALASLDGPPTVGITPEERQALLFTAQTECCRDLHALESARVVLLLELSKPKDQTRLVQAGPFVYGEVGIDWLASK
jgi:hypothetical protein